MHTARSVAAIIALSAAALFPGGPAVACGWDDETYFAEAESLPCVLAAIVGAYPEHTKEYYEARIAAADRALAWAPTWLGALDMKGVAFMKMKRLDQAKLVFLKRAEIDPDGYATHANLGTLYTFTGEFDEALKHIDKAMAIEPKAHFGREKYHRRLVVYLKEKATDPAAANKHDFLGLELDSSQRSDGNAQKFAASGQNEDVFDALVSMIAVYGAKDVPDIYFALGNVLSLYGLRRMAWTAYTRALELHHPRKADLVEWTKQLEKVLEEEHIKAVKERRAQGDYNHHAMLEAYRRAKLDSHVESYAAWERFAVTRGLSVWSDEGLATIYKQQQKLAPRCRTPGIVRDEPVVQPEKPKPYDPKSVTWTEGG